jgi:hypothetical protein
MHAADIVGYTFEAEMMCPDCTIERVLARYNDGEPYEFGSIDPEATLKSLADREGIDYMDLYSYDSDHYPKVVFASQVEDPERCGVCHELIS